MLSFKDIKDDKFKDSEFKNLYKKECHICSKTVNVIAALEEKRSQVSTILKQLNISKQEFQSMRQADKCDPDIVKKLCGYLGLKEIPDAENCPKLTSKNHADQEKSKKGQSAIDP